MSRTTCLRGTLLCVIAVFLAGLLWRKSFTNTSFEASFSRVFANSNDPAFDENAMFHSAIVIAGSNGYMNYRHQADMCHAFQLLKDNGVREHSIITFIYDDVAYHWRNPYRGKLFNKPGGRNVYQGCAKDYTGDDINKKVFLAVLQGDSAAVKGIGSGRVLRKDPRQRVFFTYSDHGASGQLILPYGPSLYADELNRAILSMKNNSMFKEMLLYIESCYAGSMFVGMDIAKEDNVLIVTASGAHESSFATYCPSSRPWLRWFRPPFPNPDILGSCMGDLFTVAWLEDTESRDLKKTKISTQVKNVTDRTSASGTYFGGSHVTMYGDRNKTIVNEFLAAFMANYRGSSGRPRTSSLLNSQSIMQWPHYTQLDADLISLQRTASRSGDNRGRREYEEEVQKRRKVDEAIHSVVKQLVKNGALNSNAPVKKFVEELIPNGLDLPIVNSWDCLREMVDAWENKCGRLDSYSGQYTRTFANLCNAMVSPASFEAALICKIQPFDFT